MVAQKRTMALAVFLALGLGTLGAKMLIWKRQADQRQATSQENAREDTNPDSERVTPANRENLPANHRTRQVFAQAMSKISEGMTEKDVLALLGKPDDVRTQYDPGGISAYRTKEIWRYGTNGHLTLPTLGCVYIDTENRVQYVYGGSGEPPDPKTIPEAELRSLLRLIDKAPYISGNGYDPLAVIQIVNALQPLGKDKALAAIDEYLRVASYFECRRGRDGVFLVLRVLFDVPADPGYMPPMLVGAPEPEEPKDPKRLPRFPILLQDDVPLLLVRCYQLGGMPPQPELYVKYFREHGRLRLRDRPLVPTNAPLGLLGSWAKNADWLYTKDSRAHGKLLIANQILNMLDSVYRLEPDAHGFRLWVTDDVDDRWKSIEAEVAKLDIRWNAEKQRYTFKDGTYLPEPVLKLYRRHIWKLEGLNGEAELILERSDEKHVSLALQWSGKTDQNMPPFTLNVFAVKEKPKILLEKRPMPSISSWAGDQVFSTHSYQLEVAEGGEVQVRLRIDGKREQVSPIYKP